MVIKCKMCGGDLVLEEGSSIGTCEYCGSTMTVPSIDDEKLANLYNRANHFRMKSEFDKAAVSYENIIAEDKNSAEAYWGLCLCKYGIEYVDDPVTEEKKPTCHRTQFTSILEDSDYRQACEKADSVARRLYEQEAQEIDRIQKQILEISSHEEPFDIFICYKESDESGERTKDSVIAQELYYALEDEGYKVFFARITLEDKLGTAYEPYIFAALNSARVMVVVSTKSEHMAAVWVKNEWSRFLDMIRQGQKKVLIPAYRDMDPYDMPEEFANLQAQDMSKIGFMQDLIRGIGKILNKGKAIKEPARDPVITQGGFGGATAALVKRGNMALEDREWERADGFFEQALNTDAECGEAYFGKLLVALKYSNMAEFAEKKIESTKDVKAESKGACGIETERINVIAEKYAIEFYLPQEEIRRICSFELTYPSTVAVREKQYKDMKEYYRANKMMERALRFAKGNFQVRLQEMCNRIDTVMEKRIAEAKKNEEEAVARITQGYQKHLDNIEIELENKNQKTKNSVYSRACRMRDNANLPEEYDEAGKIFRRISGYNDSREQAEECERKAEEIRSANYLLAFNAEEGADTIEGWDEAARLYVVCGDYRDSVERAKRCADIAENIREKEYLKAKSFMEAQTIEQYENAAKIFRVIRGYKDSAKLVNLCMEHIQNILKQKYEQALFLMNSAFTIEEYGKAKERFEVIGDYKDSKEMALKCEEMIRGLKEKDETERKAREKKRRLERRFLQIACALCVACIVGKAISAFINVKLLKPMEYYKQAEELLDSNNLSAARIYFYKAGKYKDAKERADILLAKESIAQCSVAEYSDKSIIGVKENGTVIATGYNNDVEEWKDVIEVSAGDSHIVGLKSDGKVIATGSNDYGQCDVEGWEGIIAISADTNYTVGLKSDGTVIAAGYNNDAEEWKDIVKVSAGSYHTVGLKLDGTVVATGSNDYGQCNVEEWENIIAVSAGSYHAVGLKSDGKVVATGNNNHGQCNVEEWEDIIKVSAGNSHTVGLKSDGTVVATGSNDYGQCNVEGWEGIVQVYALKNCTLGLKKDGTVVAVGNNKDKILSKVKKWTDIKVN